MEREMSTMKDGIRPWSMSALSANAQCLFNTNQYAFMRGLLELCYVSRDDHRGRDGWQKPCVSVNVMMKPSITACQKSGSQYHLKITRYL